MRLQVTDIVFLSLTDTVSNCHERKLSPQRHIFSSERGSLSDKLLICLDLLTLILDPCLSFLSYRYLQITNPVSNP